MEATLVGFFIAGLFFVLAGSLHKAPLYWLVQVLQPKWMWEFGEKIGPVFLRVGLRIWAMGIGFILLGLVPAIAIPALIIWVIARIAKRRDADP